MQSESFNKLIRHIRALRFFHLLLMFGLPFYYTWQASDVIQKTKTTDSEYRQWIGEQSTELPILHATGTVVQPEEIDSEPTSSSPFSVLCHRSMPESLLKVRVTWNTFVDSRLDEWRIAVTFAGVLVAASLTIFQIPQAIDDPFTRAFASIAAYRSFSGLVYGPIFLLYFQSRAARSVHFAFLWSQDMSSILCRLWTILSFPAVSTMWSALFFLLAIIRFFWKIAGQTATDTPIPTPVYLTLTLRGVVAISIILDLAGLSGMLLILWRSRKCCLDKMRLNDERDVNF